MSLQVLARALSKLKDNMYKRVSTTVINPKAITLDQLFGETTANLEWSDGILSDAVRSISKENDVFLQENESQQVIIL